MSDRNEELGTIKKANGRFEARLTRYIEHDQGQVWAWLTEPQHLVEWLAPGEIELRAGGRARLNFTDSGTVIDSIVSAFEPLARVIEPSPRVIEPVEFMSTSAPPCATRRGARRR